ncbi:MAG: hypothetical protein ACRYF5_18820 [Janthinobacterium lividum]
MQSQILVEVRNMAKSLREDLRAFRSIDLPELYEVEYLLAVMFAKLSSVDGLGYDEGRGGNANTSVAMFRLLGGYLLARSLHHGGVQYSRENRSTGLKALEALMTTDSCSGVVSGNLLNGRSSRDIGVRLTELLRSTQ